MNDWIGFWFVTAFTFFVMIIVLFVIFATKFPLAWLILIPLGISMFIAYRIDRKGHY